MFEFMLPRVTTVMRQVADLGERVIEVSTLPDGETCLFWRPGCRPQETSFVVEPWVRGPSHEKAVQRCRAGDYDAAILWQENVLRELHDR